MKTLIKIIVNLLILLVIPTILYFTMKNHFKQKYHEKNLEITLLEIENAKLKREKASDVAREAAREAALRSDLEAAREAAREAYEREIYETRPLAQPPKPF